jgi:AraC-like DNA-binding protein
MATVIYFPSNFLTNITDDNKIIGPIQELINKSWRGVKIIGKTQKKIANILAGIAAEKGLSKIISFLKMVQLLSQSKEFEYLASVSYENHYDARDTDRINKVYQFLIHNFHRDIQLKELSSLCNMTPNAFCRYFKSRTEKSFTQILNELRIGHACKLLHNNDYSISDICYQCGYNNLANFNKFFKSIMRIPPSMYRKQIQMAEY